MSLLLLHYACFQGARVPAPRWHPRTRVRTAGSRRGKWHVYYCVDSTVYVQYSTLYYYYCVYTTVQ